MWVFEVIYSNVFSKNLFQKFSLKQTRVLIVDWSTRAKQISCPLFRFLPYKIGYTPFFLPLKKFSITISVFLAKFSKIFVRMRQKAKRKSKSTVRWQKKNWRALLVILFCRNLFIYFDAEYILHLCAQTQLLVQVDTHLAFRMYQRVLCEVHYLIVDSRDNIDVLFFNKVFCVF